MPQRANERILYIDGQMVPESQGLVSFRDRSFRYGDGVYDMTRTFGHKIFKLTEHIERLYKSLRYLQIDPLLSPPEIMRITEEVVERNLHLIGPDEDYWVGQRVSRGIEPAGGDFHESTDPTVIVECTPLPLKARAHYFRDGIDVAVPSGRRVAPDALSPRVKTHNYLNLIVADQEVRRQNPKAWAILLDHNGNLSEGMGSNLFIVQNGTLSTPQDRYVLCGVSRETVIEEARKIGIEIVKKDIDLYDAYNAEEAFITSTSICVCPVRSINGITLGGGKVPGPVTKRITDAYIELVNFDFVAQYIKHLD